MDRKQTNADGVISFSDTLLLVYRNATDFAYWYIIFILQFYWICLPFFFTVFGRIFKVS